MDDAPVTPAGSPAPASPRPGGPADPTGQVAAATAQAPHRPRAGRTRLVLGILTLIALAASAAFLTYGVDGHWDFALPRRAATLGALAVVGAAIAVSTVVFHTITHNRILTPGIMGMDSLYVLAAASVVTATGNSASAVLGPVGAFAANTLLMTGLALVLYRWLIGDGSRGLYTLLLVGVIGGTLFGSLTSFLLRTMDPNQYDALMSDLFASFTAVDLRLLATAAALLALCGGAAWWLAPRLDVLTLGRERAIGLGVDYRRTVTLAMGIVALLVAASTALVGPLTFLGVVVANLAYRLTRTYRHRVNMVAAALVAVAALVTAQTVLQHVLRFNGTVGSLVALVGGTWFLWLLVKEARS
ncbi:iron chelate uptake ABC transporter family permease subunit [Demequina pelophila]|uniref:iron chelate uptake ABC transporter family permease subunit n=1 Tax=Demequina pelophila TaxID=1638984 RepID=UPI0007825948|nr:iron chelate uptake ABC transporter family permease subunit [Demequina pelophila]